MGTPNFSYDKNNKVILNEEISIENSNHKFTRAFFGNPHAVIVVESLGFNYQALGVKIEQHMLFAPHKTNVEFIQIVNNNEINFRVWERGSGETFACGTGACAALVVAHLLGHTDREATVHLKGGDLRIKWNSEGNVLMTGPSTLVFEGFFYYDLPSK